jgi:hypothetical protein
MKEQMLDENIAKRFLLGQLSPDEQGRIEELAFDDPDSFEVLQAAEDDLIDEFVDDDLSADERERFQEYYLAQPGRREDVRIASALREYFDREQPASLWERLRKWLHIGAMPLIPVVVKAAIIISAAAVGLVTLFPRILRPGFTPVTQVQPQPSPALPSPANTPSETPPQPTPQLAHKDDQKKPSLPPHRQPSTFAAILLSPGGGARGGGEVTKVSLTSRTKHLDLALIGGASYPSYQATLEQGGKTIQPWSNLKPTKIVSGRKGIRIPIPFDRLKASQRYHIVLDGVAQNGNLEHVDDYYFDATN